jgi:ATP-binding cassette, subfamily B, multidrug efflux pump
VSDDRTPRTRRIPRAFRAESGALGSLARAAEERPKDLLATMRRLAAYLAPFKREVVLSMLWVVVSALTMAVAPALTGRVVDAAVEASKTGAGVGAIAIPMLLLLATYLTNWFAQRSQIMGLGTVGQRALYDMRSDILDKVLDLSVAFFDRTESGDLMSRLVNDVETVNSFLTNTFRRVFGAALSVAATLVGMLLVEWRLALATLAVVPLLWLTTALFSLLARVAFRRTREAIGDVSASLAEELAGIREAQSFARTGTDRTEFRARNAANRDANILASAVSSAFSPALGLISAIATAVVAALGGWLSINGLVTIGVVVAFFAYARQFFNGINQLSSLYADTQSAIAGGERVFALLDTPIDVTEAPDAVDIGRLRGDVEFDHVSFAYPTSGEVLRDIDLRVEAGTTLAIVGHTGAGKSTIVNLVARFYDATSGAVKLDGRNVREMTTASLRRNLGVVLQEPFLFTGTVGENIRYGRLEATDAEVRRAAETARALPFIERLPDGFDTQVGERGALLSTGQRQLLAFARAILADPSILILDEATSSVDTRTEVLIQEGLRSILKGRTALVIAHRLSTVREAHRIVVLEAGRIVEDGSYSDLLAAGGAFARLHEAQFGE